MKKTIVITGGTKGIGKALVKVFAEKGFDVVTCSRNQDDLDQLKKEVESSLSSVHVYIFRADVSREEDVQQFLAFIESLGRQVDVLINNAGIFLPGQISNEAEGVFEKLIHTNLFSAYRLTRGLITSMMERKSGHIFNICSTASITPYINGGSYCISKYALYGMSKVLREEMKRHHVKVTSVLPGATFTDSWEGTDIPDSRFMKAEDVASSIWNAYEMSSATVVEEIILRPQLGDID
jgi:short-subunit dehydrogenase